MTLVHDKNIFLADIHRKNSQIYVNNLFNNPVSAKICVKILRSSSRNSLRKILSCTEKDDTDFQRSHLLYLPVYSKIERNMKSQICADRCDLLETNLLIYNLVLVT